MGYYKDLKELEKKKTACKDAILSLFPVENKGDYYIAGTFGVSAGLTLIDEFINLDSKNEEEFLDSKNLIIDFLIKELFKVKSKKFLKQSNISIVNFGKVKND